MLILLRLKFSARVGNFINLYRFLLIYLSNNFLILKDPSVSYHVFFQNMTQVNGYKGFVGYSIRELSSNEINLTNSRLGFRNGIVDNSKLDSNNFG